MNPQVPLIAALCIVALSCRQENSHREGATQDQTDLPRVTAADLPRAGADLPTTPATSKTAELESFRNEYLARRFAELPDIDGKIHDLEFAASVDRPNRRMDALDILPLIRTTRAKLEKDLRRAETASPQEFSAMRVQIDNEAFELETYLRKPSP